MITAAQLKGRIKNMCDGDSKKAEALIRLYFMERFLERVSLSEYKGLCLRRVMKKIVKLKIFRCESDGYWV